MKAKELIKLFEKQGWKLSRVRGSHHIMTKSVKIVVIPVHNKDLKTGLLNKLLKNLD